MNFRVLEIIKLCIPGLYLLLMVVLCSHIFGIYSTEDFLESDYWIILKELSAIFLFVLPFVGLIIGYFLEFLTGIFMFVVYRLGLTRPILFVLRRTWDFYFIPEYDELKRKFVIGTKINRAKAKEIYYYADLFVGKDKYAESKEHATMARNIFGAHLVGLLYVIANTGVLHGGVLVLFCVLLFLGCAWYHLECLSVRYILSDYAKYLAEERMMRS